MKSKKKSKNKETNYDRLMRLDREKRLDPDYLKKEREALYGKYNLKRNAKKKVTKIKIVTVVKVKVPKITQMSYDKFIKTAYWRYVRKLVFARDKFACTKCGAIFQLQAHHLTYKNHYKEHLHLEDLITLCRSCHRHTHGLK